DERQAKCQTFSFFQIRLDEGGPACRNVLCDLGITVSRQVGENQLRLRPPRPPHFEEVDRAGAPGRRTRLCNLGPKKRIDDAGFSDVGASEKRYFGQGWGGELVYRRCGEQESGKDAHNPVWIFCKEVASRGQAQSRPSGRLRSTSL